MWPNKADPTGNAFMVIAYAWQACSVTNFQGVERFDAGKTTVHWSRVGGQFERAKETRVSLGSTRVMESPAQRRCAGDRQPAIS